MKLFSVRNLFILLFCALIAFLFILTRSAELISQNFVFVLDQGRDYVFVKDMVVNLKPTLIGSEIGGGMAGFQGIFQGPVHFYLLSIFFILFNGNPYGGVIYMVIFALASVVASFILAKTIFKSVILGLVMALFVTISPPLISQAKFLWNPHPITFFILLSFLFTYLAYKKDLKYLFGAGFFAAFTYNFEIATTTPLVIALFVYMVLIVKIKKIKEYMSLFCGIIFGMLPFFLFEIRHKFIAVNGFIKYLSEHNRDVKEGYGLINNQLPSFIYNFFDTFPHQDTILQALVLALFILALILFVLHEKRKEIKHFILFLVILLGSAIFVLSFLRNHVFMYYLYQLNLVYIFLFTYLVYASFKQKRFDILLLFGLLSIVYVVYAVRIGLKDFNNDTKDSLAYQKVKAKIAAVDYIYKDAGNEKFGIFTFAPTVYTYPYDYLIWWRGKQFGKQPNQDKDGLFYLLIEKDPGKPWTYEGWEKTVIKEGRVIETKILPSGLIVEKRCGQKCPL